MDQDAFKEEFKKYKRKIPRPSFDDVLDFNSAEKFAEIQERVITGAQGADWELSQRCMRCGLKPFSDWRVFCLRSFPGFIYITDPFLPGWQREWVRRCICCYTDKPNICNLDAHLDRPNSSLWEDYLSMDRRAKRESLMHRLRWVTLGYHYNWTSKTYTADKHSQFPDDLAELCCCLAEVSSIGRFTAEAGIVNFYHLDSTLSGHTDHSEFDLTAPLFSISFGQEAIFLLGGDSRSVRPTAMFVRSGDIMIMSGASRMAYHAVPRVLAPPEGGSKLPRCFSNAKEVSDDKWAPLADYLSTSRINVNVRQVLKPGSSFPFEPVVAVSECCEESQSGRPNAHTTCPADNLVPSETSIPHNSEDTVGAAKKRCI